MAENEWLNKDFYKTLGVSKDATRPTVQHKTSKGGTIWLRMNG